MIQLACPVCRGGLARVQTGWSCDLCPRDYAVVDGIAHFLPPDRERHFEAFLHDYTVVRLGEGRANENPAYFRRLPEPTRGDPLAGQWRMRARSWAKVQRQLVPEGPPALAVVDVGAGTGWLSNRLSQRFHDAAAVDLTIDPADGLGAARHFTADFGRYQAEMDALPFADGCADLVIFNASLHYSTDLERTLREALRVMTPTGRLVVMDSPIYRREEDGQAMVDERHADFEKRFGTRSDSVPSVGFLTPDRLHALASTLGVRWKEHSVWYGWRWAWRPWGARLRRRRAPSRFALLVARRTS